MRPSQRTRLMAPHSPGTRALRLSTLLLLLTIACLGPRNDPASRAAASDGALADHDMSQRRRAAASSVSAAIRGSEQADVGSVFDNLQVLGGFPAENLVIAMERWSEALGVDCTHCHVQGDWAADTVPTKSIARRMVHLSNKINTELQTIEGLDSERPIVNCATCHRGALRPARRVSSAVAPPSTNESRVAASATPR